MQKILIMIKFDNYLVSDNDLNSRVNKISGSLSTESFDKTILSKILGLIDLTTLSGDDTNQRVNDLCTTAQSFENKSNSIDNVAAVCVYPVFADLVSTNLKGSNIKTACVAGAFPSGQSPLSVRIEEVKQAVADGADEIDMVISRGKLIEGNEEFVSTEVRKIKEACGNAHLKVILETGELKTLKLIRQASEIAINNGADFIKTSTGKVTPAATPTAFLVMLDTIKEYYEKTGVMIGIKPAGGISEPVDAVFYYCLVKEVLGDNWLNKDFFRIGASRLATKVYNQIISQ